MALSELSVLGPSLEVEAEDCLSNNLRLRTGREREEDALPSSRSRSAADVLLDEAKTGELMLDNLGRRIFNEGVVGAPGGLDGDVVLIGVAGAAADGLPREGFGVMGFGWRPREDDACF